jgi:hypothetical protein
MYDHIGMHVKDLEALSFQLRLRWSMRSVLIVMLGAPLACRHFLSSW